MRIHNVVVSERVQSEREETVEAGKIVMRLE